MAVTPQIAVVICSWNKKDDLLACLESLLVADPNGDLFDIIVVDNASSDGAPEAVERMYGGQGQRIKLIQLAVNIGGSGGFNAGIVEALKAGYPYIHLLDNDVVVDPLAISELYERMEADRTLGMLGSKLYMHKEPERLQEYGSFVDWERFNVRPINKGVLDHEALPELLDCDYVPACSVMVRAEAIERCGLMDNLFFIYWDDIEWGHRMKLAGYRVAVCGVSRVWHKMGAANTTTTFPTYYFWRNRIHFFAANLSEARIEALAEALFQELYQAVFFSTLKGQGSVVEALLHAFDDALGLVRGQAGEGRILKREVIPEPAFLETLSHELKLIVLDDAEISVIRSAVNFLIARTGMHVYVRPERYEGARLMEEFKNEKEKVEIESESSADHLEAAFIVKPVAHVMDIRDCPADMNVALIVDSYCNTVFSEADKRRLAGYDADLLRQKAIFLPFLTRKLQLLRNNLKGGE